MINFEYKYFQFVSTIPYLFIASITKKYGAKIINLQQKGNRGHLKQKLTYYNIFMPTGNTFYAK